MCKIKIFKYSNQQKQKQSEILTENYWTRKRYRYGHINYHCYKIYLLSRQANLKWKQKQAKNVEVKRPVKSQKYGNELCQTSELKTYKPNWLKIENRN